MSYERAWVVGVFGREFVKRAPKTDSFRPGKPVAKNVAQRAPARLATTGFIASAVTRILNPVCSFE
jgi:hypothetical protein